MDSKLRKRVKIVGYIIVVLSVLELVYTTPLAWESFCESTEFLAEQKKKKAQALADRNMTQTVTENMLDALFEAHLLFEMQMVAGFMPAIIFNKLFVSIMLVILTKNEVKAAIALEMAKLWEFATLILLACLIVGVAGLSWMVSVIGLIILRDIVWHYIQELEGNLKWYRGDGNFGSARS